MTLDITATFYEPRTRTVYVDGGIAETGALLDAILEIDRGLDRKRSEPRFDLSEN